MENRHYQQPNYQIAEEGRVQLNTSPGGDNKLMRGEDASHSTYFFAADYGIARQIFALT